jgi:hypothetical protein
VKPSNRPLVVDKVWLRVLGDGKHAAVGCRIGGLTAGTLVVSAEDAPALALLLQASPLIQAALAAVATWDKADLETFAAAMATLMVETQREATVLTDTDLGWPAEPAPGTLARAKPETEIDRALRLLFCGAPDAQEGATVFRACAAAGVAMKATPQGLQPTPFGSILGQRDRATAPAWRRLADQLRDMADTVDRQLEMAATAGPEVKA